MVVPEGPIDRTVIDAGCRMPRSAEGKLVRHVHPITVMRPGMPLAWSSAIGCWGSDMLDLAADAK